MTRLIFTLHTLVLLLLIQISMESGLAASAENGLTVFPSDSRLALGPYFEIMEDPSGSLSIDDVSDEPYSSTFVRHQSKSINQGVTRSVFWFRFTLLSPSEHPHHQHQVDASDFSEWLLYLGKQLDYFDRVQVFTRVDGSDESPGDEWRRKEFGLFHAQQRGSRDPLYISLQLPQNPEGSLTVYLRIEVESG